MRIVYKVRRMTLADVDQAHAIETQSITPPWSKEGFEETLDNKNAVLLVAEDMPDEDVFFVPGMVQRSKILGYCCLYFAADEGEITNVAVDPAYRGQGVADALLQTVQEQTVILGLSQLFLEVRESNLPAQKLYEKHGFKAVGQRKNFYREPQEDAIVMRWTW